MSSEPPQTEARPVVPERRKQGDRRRSTLRALVYGSFNPRRRRPRRAEDAGIAAVDWHDPQWLAVALLILLFSCADALLTLMLVERGAYEANPFMAAFVHGSAWGFTAVKIVLTSGGVILLTLLTKFRAFGRLPVSGVLYAILAAYGALVIYELWLLEKLSGNL